MGLEFERETKLDFLFKRKIKLTLLLGYPEESRQKMIEYMKAIRDYANPYGGLAALFKKRESKTEIITAISNAALNIKLSSNTSTTEDLAIGFTVNGHFLGLPRAILIERLETPYLRTDLRDVLMDIVRDIDIGENIWTISEKLCLTMCGIFPACLWFDIATSSTVIRRTNVEISLPRKAMMGGQTVKMMPVEELYGKSLCNIPWKARAQNVRRKFYHSGVQNC